MWAQQAADAATYGMTSGRFLPTAVAVLALGAAVLGGLARTGRTGRRGAVTAVVLGLGCAGLGAALAVTADGGLGTGNGLGGSVVAAALGLVALGLGGTALSRSRRAREQVT
jgi:hypothetical protein